MRRWTLLILLVGLAVAAGVQLGPPNGSSNVAAQDVEMRTVALVEGWNLVGWTGPDTLLVEAISGLVDRPNAAAAFDAGSQAFRTWNASAPAFLNTLDTVQQGEAIWVQVTAPSDWVQPVVADPGALSLRSGFNLITWSGPSGLEPAQSFAAIAADLNAAFAFDKPTETFASFGPSRPDFLNDLPPLIYGDGFWLLMDAAAIWAQPPAPPPTLAALDDGSATVEIPRGALPPGVAPEDVTVTALALDALPPAADAVNTVAAFEVTLGAPALPQSLRIAQIPDDGAVQGTVIWDITGIDGLPAGVTIDPATGDVVIELDSGISVWTVDASGNIVPAGLPEVRPAAVQAIDAESDPPTITAVITMRTRTPTQVLLADGINLEQANKPLGYRLEIIEPDTTEFTVGDAVTVRARVTNTGQVPLTIDTVGRILGAALSDPLADPDSSVPIFPPQLVAGGVSEVLPGNSREFVIYDGVCQFAGTSTIQFSVEASSGDVARPLPPSAFLYPAQSHTSGIHELVITCGAHPASFELLAVSFAPDGDFFSPDGVHIIVAAPPGGFDVRTALPITLTATDIPSGDAIDLTPNVLGETAVIPEPASANCRDATGCSISVGPVSEGWVRLTATDSANNIIAWQDFHAPVEGS